MEIDTLLAAMVARHASDLHLSSGVPPMIRVDGNLTPLDFPALEAGCVSRLIGSTLDETDYSEFVRTSDADYAWQREGLGRFRVNAYHHLRGPGIVFRHIPDQLPTLQSLGLDERFQQLVERRSGLILVTGPTGSGKSTTLAAMIDHLNAHRAVHILTIEDPVEFIHQSRRSLVTQREVGRDTRDFQSALRAALREDPDVILIGELRDLETIRLALTAAETGHLVLATLHTASAVQTVNRIIDVFPGDEKAMVRTMLAASMQAVISQVLVKKQSGGRVAAHEILLATSAIRHLIREDKVAQMYSSIQTGAAIGMQTLDAALGILKDSGAIGADVYETHARFPAGMPPGSR